jgi:hypothetical protein
MLMLVGGILLHNFEIMGLAQLSPLQARVFQVGNVIVPFVMMTSEVWGAAKGVYFPRVGSTSVRVVVVMIGRLTMYGGYGWHQVLKRTGLVVLPIPRSWQLSADGNHRALF